MVSKEKSFMASSQTLVYGVNNLFKTFEVDTVLLDLLNGPLNMKLIGFLYD